MLDSGDEKFITLINKTHNPSLGSTYIIGHHGVPQSLGMMMKTAHICAFFFAYPTRGHTYNLV